MSDFKHGSWDGWTQAGCRCGQCRVGHWWRLVGIHVKWRVVVPLRERLPWRRDPVFFAYDVAVGEARTVSIWSEVELSTDELERMDGLA